MPTRDLAYGGTTIEALLRRDRLMVGAGLVLAIALAWLYLVPTAHDMYGAMDGLSAWMMTATWDAGYLLAIFLMWSVMMLGMMLPGASPTILLYARTVRSIASPDAPVLRTYIFAGGYLVAWTAFSLAATLLQWLLARVAWVSPMMETASPTLGAALLVVAGLYQWTPLKRRCLSHCRSPLYWLPRHWRPGRAGAFAMGLHHGFYCVGCCWAVMLLLFVGGVMNLFWITLITLFVLGEKLAPGGAWAGRLMGAALALVGLWTMMRG